MSNDYKVVDTKDSLKKICEGTIELDWSSASCNIEEENLIVGLIVGHEMYVKKVLSYLPDNFQEEIYKLYKEANYVQSETSPNNG